MLSIYWRFWSCRALRLSHVYPQQQLKALQPHAATYQPRMDICAQPMDTQLGHNTNNQAHLLELKHAGHPGHILIVSYA